MTAADAQALADVRTLDEWAGLSPTRWHDVQYWEGHWTCNLDSGGMVKFFGPTPDAARHAAAEWVRGQK